MGDKPVYSCVQCGKTATCTCGSVWYSLDIPSRIGFCRICYNDSQGLETPLDVRMEMQAKTQSAPLHDRMLDLVVRLNGKKMKLSEYLSQQGENNAK